MTINKILITIALIFVIAACTNSDQPSYLDRLEAAERASAQETADLVKDKDTVEVLPGLEKRIESFTKPDKFGVVCYQSRSTSQNLSCVKVQ